MWSFLLTNWKTTIPYLLCAVLAIYVMVQDNKIESLEVECSSLEEKLKTSESNNKGLLATLESNDSICRSTLKTLEERLNSVSSSWETRLQQELEAQAALYEAKNVTVEDQEPSEIKTVQQPRVSDSTSDQKFKVLLDTAIQGWNEEVER